jgi:hypothetical protein
VLLFVALGVSLGLTFGLKDQNHQAKVKEQTTLNPSFPVPTSTQKMSSGSEKIDVSSLPPSPGVDAPDTLSEFAIAEKTVSVSVGGKVRLVCFHFQC